MMESLDFLFEETTSNETWGSIVEIETRRRIRLSLWAYSYEILSVSLVDDKTFDEEARKVDLSIKTSNSNMDKWFKNNFNPSTGMWIHNHPELHKIKKIYENLYN